MFSSVHLPAPRFAIATVYIAHKSRSASGLGTERAHITSEDKRFQAPPIGTSVLGLFDTERRFCAPVDCWPTASFCAAEAQYGQPGAGMLCRAAARRVAGS